MLPKVTILLLIFFIIMCTILVIWRQLLDNWPFRPAWSEYITGTWPNAPITSQSRPIRWFPFCDMCQPEHRVRSSQGPRPVNSTETR
jgi:hypothetical protein